MGGDLFFNFREFALLLGFFLLKFIDVVAVFLDLSLYLTDLFFSLVRFCLQVHLELFVLLLILLESLFALIELVFLHDDVLTQEFCLLSLLVDLDLSHQDLARVVNEVPHCLFLLATFVEVLNGLRFVSLTLLR